MPLEVLGLAMPLPAQPNNTLDIVVLLTQGFKIYDPAGLNLDLGIIKEQR